MNDYEWMNGSFVSPPSNFSLPSNLEPSNVLFFLSVIKYLVKATSNRKGFLSLAHSLRHRILVEKDEGGTWSSCLYCVWSQEESNARRLLSSLPTYTGSDPSEAVTHNGRIFSLNNTVKVIPKGHAEQLISRWFQIQSRWQHWSSHCQKCQSFPLYSSILPPWLPLFCRKTLDHCCYCLPEAQCLKCSEHLINSTWIEPLSTLEYVVIYSICAV